MFKNITKSVGNLASAAGDIKNMGVEAMQSTVSEFNEVRPLFGQIGYQVDKVDMVIGLTPKITFALRRITTVDDAAFDVLLAGHEGNRVLATIVAALRQASLLQARVQFKGLSFAVVEVELGIPPAIRLGFEAQVLTDSESDVLVPAGPLVAEVQVQAPPPPPPPTPRNEPAPSTPERHPDREKDLAELIAVGIAVQFDCKGCGKKLVTRARNAGREGECRRCGAVHVIPAPSLPR